jgi:vacuolar-type H+-ATPase subunit F/Vma7
MLKSGRARVQFAVGFKLQGKTEHVVVDAEDALVAALKVKIQRPEAVIAYVRQQNKRGDTRHPMRRLSGESP